VNTSAAPRSPLRYLLLLPVAALGVATILATAPTSVTQPSSSLYYANWNCNNQSQCIATMGDNSNTGSAGPFCTQAACDKWRQSYFFGATCDVGPAKHTVFNAPAAGTCQT
jgi:hypothetical protein